MLCSVNGTTLLHSRSMTATTSESPMSGQTLMAPVRMMSLTIMIGLLVEWFHVYRITI